MKIEIKVEEYNGVWESSQIPALKIENRYWCIRDGQFLEILNEYIRVRYPKEEFEQKVLSLYPEVLHEKIEFIYE